METFKRTPTFRMLAAEVRDTTVELQSSGTKNQYMPAIYLSPTGAEVNRVLIAGTAIDKEDMGKDTSFWRLRVADPTGAVFVYAGQYQPEAAKAIQKLEVPCFVIVSGKLAHYNPDQGGETIVSIRAESLTSVSIELRDLALADIAHHTVRRLQEARKNEKVREYYPNYEYSAFIQSISTLLDQILEDPPSALNVGSCAPSVLPQFQPVPPSIPAVIPSSPPAVQINNAVNLRPETPVQPPMQESVPKGGSKPSGLHDSTSFVLDILKTHKQEPGIPKETLQNVLKSLGYAMLDVDRILAKLKSAGEIIEPRSGLFKAV